MYIAACTSCLRLFDPAKGLACDHCRHRSRKTSQKDQYLDFPPPPSSLQVSPADSPSLAKRGRDPNSLPNSEERPKRNQDCNSSEEDETDYEQLQSQCQDSLVTTPSNGKHAPVQKVQLTNTSTPSTPSHAVTIVGEDTPEHSSPHQPMPAHPPHQPASSQAPGPQTLAAIDSQPTGSLSADQAANSPFDSPANLEDSDQQQEDQQHDQMSKAPATSNEQHHQLTRGARNEEANIVSEQIASTQTQDGPIRTSEKRQEEQHATQGTTTNADTHHQGETQPVEAIEEARGSRDRHGTDPTLETPASSQVDERQVESQLIEQRQGEEQRNKQQQVNQEATAIKEHTHRQESIQLDDVTETACDTSSLQAATTNSNDEEQPESQSAPQETTRMQSPHQQIHDSSTEDRPETQTCSTNEENNREEARGLSEHATSTRVKSTDAIQAPTGTHTQNDIIVEEDEQSGEHQQAPQETTSKVATHLSVASAEDRRQQQDDIQRERAQSIHALQRVREDEEASEWTNVIKRRPSARSKATTTLATMQQRPASRKALSRTTSVSSNITRVEEPTEKIPTNQMCAEEEPAFSHPQNARVLLPTPITAGQTTIATPTEETPLPGICTSKRNPITGHTVTTFTPRRENSPSSTIQTVLSQVSSTQQPRPHTSLPHPQQRSYAAATLSKSALPTGAANQNASLAHPPITSSPTTTTEESVPTTITTPTVTPADTTMTSAQTTTTTPTTTTTITTTRRPTNKRTAPSKWTPITNHSQHATTTPPTSISTPPTATTIPIASVLLTPPQYKCIQTCGLTFESDNDLLAHVTQVHSLAGFVHLSLQQIQTIGLVSCEECWGVRLIGSAHPNPCRPIEIAKEALATKSKFKACLATSSLIEIQFMDLQFIQDSSWSAIFNRNLIPFDSFPTSPSLQDAFRYIIQLITKQMFTNTEHDNDNKECATKLFFMLPWLLLQHPAHRTKSSLSATVHARIQIILAGDWNLAYEQASKNQHDIDKRNDQQKPPTQGDTQRLKKVIKQASQGNLTKATALLASDAKILSAADPDVFDKLQALFPEPDQVRQREPVQPIQTEFNRINPHEVKTALTKSTKAGAGPSGWHISAIKTLGQTADGLITITKILNYLLGDTCPDGLLAGLRTGSLTPLSKANGGVRPIIITDTWTRLLAKTILQREQQKLGTDLAPLQTGVGLRGGVEFTIHSTRALLDANPSWIAIAVDCRNAYGAIRKTAIKSALEKNTKEDSELTLRYFNKYVTPTLSIKTRDGQTFQSEEGVPQGDPLSPLLFALGLQGTLNKINHWLQQSQPDNCKLFAYLDDVIIIGAPDLAFSTYNKFKETAVDIGLIVNPDKTQVLNNSTNQTVPYLCDEHGLPSPSAAIKLLGTYIGEQQQVTEALKHALQTNIYARLQQLPNKQIAMLLLRHTINQQNAHIARVALPSTSASTLKLHDDMVVEVLTSILGLQQDSLQKNTITEIRLPLSMGGLGLTSLHDTSQHAYLSSVANTLQVWRNFVPDADPLFTNWLPSTNQTRLQAELSQSLQASTKTVSDAALLHNITTTVSTTTAATAATATATSQTPKRTTKARLKLPSQIHGLLAFTSTRKLQHTLNHAHAQIQLHTVKHQLSTTEEKAQFISKTGHGASAFLQAIPSDPGLRFSNLHFKLALHLFLRLQTLPVMGIKEGVRCACARIDTTGSSQTLTEQHVLNCKYGNTMTRRHCALVNVFIDMIHSTKLHTVIEPLASPGSGKQDRYDFTVDKFNNHGTNIKADVTVRNPCALHIMIKASTTPLHAASHACDTKTKHYTQFLNANDKFVPLAIETFGAMHGNVPALIATMAARVLNAAPDRATWAAPTFTAYWTQRLSVCLWTENSESVATTCRLSKMLQQTGNLHDEHQHRHEEGIETSFTMQPTGVNLSASE